MHLVLLELYCINTRNTIGDTIFHLPRILLLYFPSIISHLFHSSFLLFSISLCRDCVPTILFNSILWCQCAFFSLSLYTFFIFLFFLLSSCPYHFSSIDIYIYLNGSLSFEWMNFDLILNVLKLKSSFIFYFRWNKKKTLRSYFSRIGWYC